jgi:hypothetical protein
MEQKFVNYFSLLELPKSRFVVPQDTLLDAYLRKKAKISENAAQLPPHQVEEELQLLAEALRVLMLPNLRVAHIRQIKTEMSLPRGIAPTVDTTPRNSAVLKGVSETDLFRGLIAIAEGKTDHHLAMVSKEDIEIELVRNRLWAMHVIKEVVRTKKLPKMRK